MPRISRKSPTPPVVNLISSSSSSSSLSGSFLEKEPPEYLAASLQSVRKSLRPTAPPDNPSRSRYHPSKHQNQRFRIDADEELESSSQSSSESTSSHPPSIDLAADADDEDAVPPPRPPGPRHVFTKPDTDCVLVPVKPWNGRGPPRPVFNLDTKGNMDARMHDPSSSGQLKRGHEQEAGGRERCTLLTGKNKSRGKGMGADAQGEGDVLFAVSAGGRVCTENQDVPVNRASDPDVSIGGVKSRSRDGCEGDCDHPSDTPCMIQLDGRRVLGEMERPSKRVKMDSPCFRHSVLPENRIFLPADGDDEASFRGGMERGIELGEGVVAACDAEENLERPEENVTVWSLKSRVGLDSKSANNLVKKCNDGTWHKTAPDLIFASSCDNKTASLLRLSDNPPSQPPVFGMDSMCASDEGRDAEEMEEESLGFDAETFANHWREAIIEEALVAYRLFVKSLDHDTDHLCAPVDMSSLRKMMHLIGKELGAMTRMTHVSSGTRVAYFRPHTSKVFPKSKDAFCDAVSKIVDHVINARFRCNDGTVLKSSASGARADDNGNKGRERVVDQHIRQNLSEDSSSFVLKANHVNTIADGDGETLDRNSGPCDKSSKAATPITNSDSKQTNNAEKETFEGAASAPHHQPTTPAPTAACSVATKAVKSLIQDQQTSKANQTDSRDLHMKESAPCPSETTLGASHSQDAEKEAEREGEQDAIFSFVSSGSKSPTPTASMEAAQTLDMGGDATIGHTTEGRMAHREPQASTGKSNRRPRAHKSARISGPDAPVVLLDAIGEQKMSEETGTSPERVLDASGLVPTACSEPKPSEEDLGLSTEDIEMAMAAERSLLGTGVASPSLKQAEVEIDGAGPSQKATPAPQHDLKNVDDKDRQHAKKGKLGFIPNTGSERTKGLSPKVADALDGRGGRVRKSGRRESSPNGQKTARTRQQVKDGQQKEAQWEALKRIQREMKERKVTGREQLERRPFPKSKHDAPGLKGRENLSKGSGRRELRSRSKTGRQ